MSTKDGGPAFPCVEPGELADIHYHGMSLRDYFAGQAFMGLLANPKLAPEILKRGGAHGGWIEESVWAWADAALQKRGVQSP